MNLQAVLEGQLLSLCLDNNSDYGFAPGMTPAMWAAYRTFGMFPIRLIIRSGADLNAHEHLSGNTALHIAAQERNYTSIR